MRVKLERQSVPLLVEWIDHCNGDKPAGGFDTLVNKFGVPDQLVSY